MTATQAAASLAPADHQSALVGASVEAFGGSRSRSRDRRAGSGRTRCRGRPRRPRARSRRRASGPRRQRARPGRPSPLAGEGTPRPSRRGAPRPAPRSPGRGRPRPCGRRVAWRAVRRWRGVGAHVGVVGPDVLAHGEPGQPHDRGHAGGHREQLHRTATGRAARAHDACGAAVSRGCHRRRGHAQVGREPLEIVEVWRHVAQPGTWSESSRSASAASAPERLRST